MEALSFSFSPLPAKGYLAALGISRVAAARHLGVTPSWLGRVLNGHDVPGADLSRRLADLLDVAEDDLFLDGRGS
jgi:transcriptional regulator with XRE-family HTH domain